MGRRKTPEEIGFLTRFAPHHSHAETIAEFERRFGSRLSPSALSSWMHDNGLRVVSGACRRFTGEERSFLASLVPGRSYREIADAFNARFPPITVSQVKSFINNNGLSTGRTGRFEKGNVPANKGKTWDEMGVSFESQRAMRRTCFKPGHMPHNAVGKPVGYERVTPGGYVEVKVAERPSRPGIHDNFKLKHRLVWERANGCPVPEGCIIVFADGDRRNFEPENLVCMSMADHAVVAHERMPYYDRESCETAMLAASVLRRARRRALEGRSCAEPEGTDRKELE